jgi:hypothetical protein
MYNKNDKAMMVGLKHLLNEATFPLKRREVATFVQVMTWLHDLETRIDDDLKPKPSIKKKVKKGVSK